MEYLWCKNREQRIARIVCLANGCSCEEYSDMALMPTNAAKASVPGYDFTILEKLIVSRSTDIQNSIVGARNDISKIASILATILDKLPSLIPAQATTMTTQPTMANHFSKALGLPISAFDDAIALVETHEIGLPEMHAYLIKTQFGKDLTECTSKQTLGDFLKWFDGKCRENVKVEKKEEPTKEEAPVKRGPGRPKKTN